LSGSRQHSGITLIELLIMLTVVMILTLLSIPLFTNLIQHYRITTAVENLYSSLQYARTESIKRNVNVYVSFTTGDSWCYGINTGSTCNCATAGNCNLGSFSAPAAQLLTLSTSGLSSNSFYFDTTHGGASTTGTITYTLYGQSSLITTSISRLGNIQTCSTGISGYTAC
jgi:type IV fimbrial biogenesis protein FimT